MIKHLNKIQIELASCISKYNPNTKITITYENGEEEKIEVVDLYSMTVDSFATKTENIKSYKIEGEENE